jgi:hypothetical protein
MLNLPEWASGYIAKKGCPQCGTSMGNSKINFVGIREGGDGKYYLCFDSICSTCQTQANTTIITDVEFSPKQLAAEIFASCRDDVEDMQQQYIYHKKKGKRNRNSNRMNAFNKESAKFVEFLKSCDVYEDILREIGLTDEEIKKYANGQ